MILAGAPVPEVITLVVMMVMGDLMPGLLVTPGRKRVADTSRFSQAPFRRLPPPAAPRFERARARPGRRPSPVAPACVMMADMGMVLMMVVVPGFVVLGDTLLMPRMVGFVPAPPACVVVMMVVGLPSADVTSFRMVPAGRGPLVCTGETRRRGRWARGEAASRPDGSGWSLRRRCRPGSWALV